MAEVPQAPTVAGELSEVIQPLIAPSAGPQLSWGQFGSFPGLKQTFLRESG
jgi:hypothetical protein